MLAEFSVEPLGEGAHLGDAVSRIVDLVGRSGLDHQVTAMGTLVEGAPESVWRLLERCHALACSEHERVMMHVRIDDRRGAGQSLREQVSRVEKILHKPVAREPGGSTSRRRTTTGRRRRARQSGS